MLAYTLILAALLMYLHYSYVSPAVNTGALTSIFRNASTPVNGSKEAHILEVTIVAPGSAVRFRPPESSEWLQWEAPSGLPAAHIETRPGVSNAVAQSILEFGRLGFLHKRADPLGGVLRLLSANTRPRGRTDAASESAPAPGVPTEEGKSEVESRVLSAGAMYVLQEILPGGDIFGASLLGDVASALAGLSPSPASAAGSASPASSAAPNQRVYQFSRERGLLFLVDDSAASGSPQGSPRGSPQGSAGSSPRSAAESGNRDWMRVSQLQLPADFSGFGPPATRWLLELCGGTDVAIVSAMHSAFSGRGFLRAVHAGRMYTLGKSQDIAAMRGDAGTWLAFKVGTLLSALFVVFAAMGLTSFMFAETQRRMVRFTLALGHAVRSRRPVLRLVFAHSLESLMFVPIIIGLLFFMFEFFSDKLLAFLVFMALWACEVFAVVTVRTVQSIRVFPASSMLCLTWLMVYVLAFPFGLHQLALSCVIAALVTCGFSQWTDYELPALLAGRLSEVTPRESITLFAAQGLTNDLVRHLQRGAAVLDAGLALGGGPMRAGDVVAGMGGARHAPSSWGARSRAEPPVADVLAQEGGDSGSAQEGGDSGSAHEGGDSGSAHEGGTGGSAHEGGTGGSAQGSSGVQRSHAGLPCPSGQIHPAEGPSAEQASSMRHRATAALHGDDEDHHRRHDDGGDHDDSDSDSADDNDDDDAIARATSEQSSALSAMDTLLATG
jgi:hypothetical protein